MNLQQQSERQQPNPMRTLTRSERALINTSANDLSRRVYDEYKRRLTLWAAERKRTTRCEITRADLDAVIEDIARALLDPAATSV